MEARRALKGPSEHPLKTLKKCELHLLGREGGHRSAALSWASCVLSPGISFPFRDRQSLRLSPVLARRGRWRPKRPNYKSQRPPRGRCPPPTPATRSLREGASGEGGCRPAADVCGARASAAGARGLPKCPEGPRPGAAARCGAAGPEKGEAQDLGGALTHPGAADLLRAPRASAGPGRGAE